MTPPPSRGEVWLINLDPTVGHEQAGKRPALVVSTDAFNSGPAGLVMVVPITSKGKRTPFHVALEPPEGGVKMTSYLKCEDLRSVSTNRLEARWGSVSAQTLQAVESRLRILLEL